MKIKEFSKLCGCNPKTYEDMECLPFTIDWANVPKTRYESNADCIIV